MENSAPAPLSSRAVWLDAARGMAVAAMIVYHFVWDLTFFRFVPESLFRAPAFALFGHTIAASFLFIAGIAMAFATRRGLVAGHFILRLGMVSGAAALVTVATRFAFPETYVSFGILHCIAAASVVSALFVRLPWWSAALAGALMLAAGFSIASPAFDAVNGWLGLGERIPLSNDWRPLLPWGGFMPLGLAFGKLLLARVNGSAAAPDKPGRPLATLLFAGRHSLAIYLLHQPLLFGLVWIAAQFVEPQAPAAATPAPFIEACARNCTRAGSSEYFCTRACGCIVSRSRDAGIWDGVWRNALSEVSQREYQEIIAACQADTRRE